MSALSEWSDNLGPILQNSISAENFSDAFSSSFFGQIYAPKTANVKIIGALWTIIFFFVAGTFRISPLIIRGARSGQLSHFVLHMPGAKLLPIWLRPVALAPLNDTYIFKPSFNLPLSVSIGLVMDNNLVILW
jgi:hypothetical protein